jgi:hypothetical protein
VGYLRFRIGVIAAILFAIAGFVATNEAGDLDRAYVWLGLAVGAATLMAAFPRPAAFRE